MYSQLRQEISRLKQDRCFVNNLGVTAIVAIACSLTIADLRANFSRPLEQNSTPAINSTRTAVGTYPAFN